MKSIILFALFVIGSSLNAQVIVKGEEWVMLNSGKKEIVNITKVGETHIHIIRLDDEEKRELKVPLSSIKDFKSQDLWTIPFNEVEGKIEYSEVVQVEGVSKNELFNRARLWFADTFKSSKSVLELDDRESGALVGTGFSTVSNDGLGLRDIWLTIKIQCKEGRFKYTLYNIEQRFSTSTYTSITKQSLEETRMHRNPNIGGNEKRFKKNILLALQSYCDSIKAAVGKKKVEDDNW